MYTINNNDDKTKNNFVHRNIEEEESKEAAV
jgi:hypothetical protein